MPSKKKRYNARFPPARIKKIMQTDDEVGKVAAAVPVIISRALELFVESLVRRTSEITRSRNAKTLTPSHIKSCILGEAQFQFLKDLVATIPDVQPEDDGQYPNSSASSDVPRTPTRPRQQRRRRRNNNSNNDENSAGNRESTADETETGSEDDDEDDDESEGASSENTSDQRLTINSQLPHVSNVSPAASVITPNYYLPQNFQAAASMFSQSPTFSGLSCSTATATSTEDDDYDS